MSINLIEVDVKIGGECVVLLIIFQRQRTVRIILFHAQLALSLGTGKIKANQN